MKRYNRIWHRSAALILALMLGMTVFYSPAQAAGTTVEILMNGSPVEFPDNPPYYDTQAGRIYVPIRAITENMQAVVEYNDTDRTVSIERGSTSMLLTIGSNEAIVNGIRVELDAPAYIENGSTYVPLRFVSENLALSVLWDPAALTVSLQPAPNAGDGMTQETLTSMYGSPARTELSEKGYTWWVYDDYSDYRLFGIVDGIVVARYEHNDHWVLENGLRYGMSKDDCEQLLAASSVDDYGSYRIYTLADTSVTVYYDKNDAAYAVLEELTPYTQQCTVTVSVLDGTARLLRDQVNVARAQQGLAALTADDTIKAIAKGHSTDMAGGNFYAHTGSDGRTSSERVSDAGYTDFYQTQIIAKSYPNAMAAFCAHYNNAQYRTVMTADYSALGIGVAYNAQSDGLFYYTQVFFTYK